MRIKGKWVGKNLPHNSETLAAKVSRNPGKPGEEDTLYFEICGNLEKKPTVRAVQVLALGLYQKLQELPKKDEILRCSIEDPEKIQNLLDCGKPKPIKTLERTDWWNHLPEKGDPEILELLQVRGLKDPEVPEVWKLLVLSGRLTPEELEQALPEEEQIITTAWRISGRNQEDTGKNQNPKKRHWTPAAVKREIGEIRKMNSCPPKQGDSKKIQHFKNIILTEHFQKKRRSGKRGKRSPAQMALGKKKKGLLSGNHRTNPRGQQPRKSGKRTGNPGSHGQHSRRGKPLYPRVLVSRMVSRTRKKAANS